MIIPYLQLRNLRDRNCGEGGLKSKPKNGASVSLVQPPHLDRRLVITSALRSFFAKIGMPLTIPSILFIYVCYQQGVALGYLILFLAKSEFASFA